MSSITVFTDKNRYYLYQGKVNMNKSFDGLSGIVSITTGRTIMEGEAYAFLNQAQTHLKILLREDGRFTMLYSRLDKGRFPSPPGKETAEGVVDLSPMEILMLIKALCVERSKKKRELSTGRTSSKHLAAVSLKKQK